MTMAERIRHVRESRGVSQKAMAEALGITPQYLCDLEHGRRLGSVEVVERLCDWLALGKRSALRSAWHRAGAQSHGWKI